MIDPHTVPKPPAVAQLPQDPRGYPVFFSIQPPEGRPLNFRVINQLNVIACAKRRLCGICGLPLDYWIVFIAGPVEAESRHFGEPPMHEACATYALTVCPFLAGTQYQPKHQIPDGFFAMRDLGGARQEPWKAIYRTRDYRWWVEGNTVVFHAAPAKEVIRMVEEAPR